MTEFIEWEFKEFIIDDIKDGYQCGDAEALQRFDRLKPFEMVVYLGQYMSDTRVRK